jgi:hypothetical protein
MIHKAIGELMRTPMGRVLDGMNPRVVRSTLRSIRTIRDSVLDWTIPPDASTTNGNHYFRWQATCDEQTELLTKEDLPPGAQVGDPCEVSVEDQGSICLAPDLVCAEGGVRCEPGQGGCACAHAEDVTCADGHCCAKQYGRCVELAEHCGEDSECRVTFFMDDADYPPAYVCGPEFGLECDVCDFCQANFAVECTTEQCGDVCVGQCSMGDGNGRGPPCPCDCATTARAPASASMSTSSAAPLSARETAPWPLATAAPAEQRVRRSSWGGASASATAATCRVPSRASRWTSASPAVTVSASLWSPRPRPHRHQTLYWHQHQDQALF